MESIMHDAVNAVNSGNYEFMIKVLFPSENYKRVEKAARFLRRAMKVDELCEKSGEELMEIVSREEGGDRFEDVSKLINDFCKVAITSTIGKFFDPFTGRGECVICMEEFQDVGLKCKICKNVFHSGCLGVAVGMTDKCPICRTEIE